MGFNCGIVGLPNVGKSSLFNALTASTTAEAANFPFTTIEPNVGRVSVPDVRLDRIASIARSAKVVPTQLEFVDIAGLVAGASRGEGLGNQFLANIREVDAVLHVLRCFENDDVHHVAGAVDPLNDADVIETELMLADLESLEKRETALTKKSRGGDQDARDTLAVIEPILTALRQGKPARTVTFDADRQKLVRGLQLLTSKPVLFVCNVDEASAATGNALSGRVAERAAVDGANVVVVSARIEAELAEIADPEERAAFLQDLGLGESGLARIIVAGYRLLHLLTFFTAGPKESRAWTINTGTKAPQAAGVIHSDFERGFIRAEAIAYEDFVALGGEQASRDAGRLRSEGRDYIVQDGDVLLFRFNV